MSPQLQRETWIILASLVERFVFAPLSSPFVPRIREIVSEIPKFPEGGVEVWIDYVNYKGEHRRRHIRALEVYEGTSEYHKTSHLFVRARDLDRDLDRTFAVTGIRAWRETPP